MVFQLADRVGQASQPEVPATRVSPVCPSSLRLRASKSTVASRPETRFAEGEPFMADMVRKSDSTETNIVFGKKLPKGQKISYAWEWDSYPDFDTLKAAGDTYTNDEQVKGRNNERKNKARNAAMLAAFKAAGHEKPSAENDDQIRLKDAVKNLLTAKNADGTPRYNEEQARALASQIHGIQWADEDED